MTDPGKNNMAQQKSDRQGEEQQLSFWERGIVGLFQANVILNALVLLIMFVVLISMVLCGGKL